MAAARASAVMVSPASMRAISSVRSLALRTWVALTTPVSVLVLTILKCWFALAATCGEWVTTRVWCGRPKAA